MNIYLTQQSIVTQLQQTFDGANLPFAALDLPDSVSDFKRAVLTPIVYVIYTGSTADPSISSSPVVQSRRLSFNIEIQARSLYNANGLFVARDIVEQSLIGFKPTNCHQITLKKDDIGQTEDGIWNHILQIECETMLIQKDESDPIIIQNFEGITETD